MNLSKSTSKSTFFGLILILAVSVSNAFAGDIETELQSHIDTFQGNNFQQQRKVIDQLAWAGISDPRLYDVIVAKLNEAQNEGDKPAAERAAWYAKALSRSGNEKYRAVLETTAAEADSKKVRKHAKKVIPVLAQYIEWNPKISAGVENAPAGRLMQHRIANMLKDSDVLLMRIGAKRVYWGHSDDKELVAHAAERLKQDYAVANGDEQVDAVAWLIKALAQSGDAAYKPLLAEIASGAEHKKVRKYAKKYAGYL